MNDKHHVFLLFAICGYIGAQVIVNAAGCTDTGKTVQLVQECPQTEQTWTEAAARKNCGRIPHSCASFVYHCVMNTRQNETVEVCAPKQQIVGNFCAEYNFRGNRVQLNVVAKCAECPAVYNSTKSYRYPECYIYPYVRHADPSSTTQRNTQPTSSVTKRNDTTKNQQSDDDTGYNNAVIPVVFVIVVAAVATAVVAIHNRRKKSHDPEDKDIHEPLKTSDKTTNETLVV